MNELKRELSKLSGVDFFNPKYRDVFKKYFTEKEDAKDEGKDEDVPVMDTEEVKKEAEPVKEDAVEKEPVEEKVEDVDKAEDEREIDKIEEKKAESPEKADEKAEEVDEESKVKIYITLFVHPDAVIKELSSKLQTNVKDTIKKSLDLDVTEVNIRIKNIAVKKEPNIKE
jgi:uncharacterized alkaline shock family protein YloU